MNANIKTLLRRGRGYKNIPCPPLKAQGMVVTKSEFIGFRKAACVSLRILVQNLQKKFLEAC